MPAPGGNPQFRAGRQVGWDDALAEIEHQAEHWATPDHGRVGQLIAEALRAAVTIARGGGLRCEHRGGSATVPESVLQLVGRTPELTPLEGSETPEPPASAS